MIKKNRSKYLEDKYIKGRDKKYTKIQIGKM
jgi:hypothetical protein